MQLEDEIKKLMGESDDLSKLKLDVIRVLAVFNGVSWMSEIIPDIMKIHGYVLDYPLTDELLNEALRELESKGLILVEPRRRGEFPSGSIYEDKLIKLRDLRIVRKVLTGDEVYKGYLSWQMDVIRRVAEDLE